jgi:hypothetical protein
MYIFEVGVKKEFFNSPSSLEKNVHHMNIYWELPIGQKQKKLQIIHKNGFL